MKKTIAAILTVIFCLTLSITVFAADKVPKRVLDARDGVVRVYTTLSNGTSTGSGFGVGINGDTKYIVTNNHVIEGNTEIKIFFGKAGSCKATVIQADPSIDLAILKLETPQSKIKALPFAHAEIGNNVFTLGFPGIADDGADSTGKQADKDYMTIGSGIVSSIKKANISGSDTPIKSIQTDASMHHGNSGGPLVNTNGHVVGVNSFGFSNDDNEVVNFAISSDVLVKFLDDNRIPYTEKGKAYDLPLFAIILIAVFALIIVILIAVIVIMLSKLKHKQTALATASTKPINELVSSVPRGAAPVEPEPVAFAVVDAPFTYVEPLPRGAAPVEPASFAAPPATATQDVAAAILPHASKKSAKSKIITICAISLAALIILGFGIFNLIQWSLINTAMKSNDYGYAKELYNAAPYMQAFNQDQYTYCCAMLALEQNNMSKAKEYFMQILDYEDSGAYVGKIKQYTRVMNMKCTALPHFIDKYNTLLNLGSFGNSAHLAQVAYEEFYIWAVDCYEKRYLSETTALKVFTEMGDYGDAPYYAEFLNKFVNAKELSDKRLLIANYYIVDQNSAILRPYLNDNNFMSSLIPGSEWYSKDEQYNLFWPDDGEGYYDLNIPGSDNFGSASFEVDGIYSNSNRVCSLRIIDFLTIELQIKGYKSVTLIRTSI